jgi:alkanesulfonate monooxygenase SsuD/methylene tetrahydromethanopterin reductase-like flavin-dependent oxidoreductase (luciferase family)
MSWNDPRESVLEGITVLAGLAEATTRIRLGPLVANNTNRHPGRLAKIAATLQEISAGRFELGLGAGGYEDEQARFGINQGTSAERTDRLAEALQIIPALWTGEPVTFRGAHYQLTDAVCAPGVQPAPRIIVGAQSARTAHVAGRYADGLNLQWRHREKYPAVLQAFDEGLAVRGLTRAEADLSLHPSWNDLGSQPMEQLRQWATLGFSRVMIYIAPPFPLDEIKALARQMY